MLVIRAARAEDRDAICAVAIWRAYGFEIVGRLPGAFEHPRLGFVDALVMYKQL